MADAYTALQKELKSFDGIERVKLTKAVEDQEDGGVMPAAVSLAFTASAVGMHALEFLTWAVEDMSRAGAEVHMHLTAPPPWLNEPGSCLAVNLYVNPRSDDPSTKKALGEIEEEIREMADFLEQVRGMYWPLCHPGFKPPA